MSQDSLCQCFGLSDPGLLVVCAADAQTNKCVTFQNVERAAEPVATPKCFITNSLDCFCGSFLLLVGFRFLFNTAPSFVSMKGVIPKLTRVTSIRSAIPHHQR